MNTSILKATEILGGQSALARSAGVSQPAAFKWFHGTAKPSRNAAKAIALATGWRVTPYELNPAAFDHPDDGLPEHLRGRSKGEAA